MKEKEELKKFDFVFLIRLRYADKEPSLAELIISQYNRLEVMEVQSENVKAKLKGKTKHKTLLLLDGYDEYKPGMNKDIDNASWIFYFNFDLSPLTSSCANNTALQLLGLPGTQFPTQIPNRNLQRNIQVLIDRSAEKDESVKNFYKDSPDDLLDTLLKLHGMLCRKKQVCGIIHQTEQHHVTCNTGAGRYKHVT